MPQEIINATETLPYTVIWTWHDVSWFVIFFFNYLPEFRLSFYYSVQFSGCVTLCSILRLAQTMTIMTSFYINHRCRYFNYGVLLSSFSSWKLVPTHAHDTHNHIICTLYCYQCVTIDQNYYSFWNYLMIFTALYFSSF